LHFNYSKSSLESQHEDLGNLGVNLIHSLFRNDNPEIKTVIKELLDNIPDSRITVDAINTNLKIPKHELPLELIKNGFTKNVILSPEGKSIVDKDLFFRKNAIFRFLENPRITSKINNLIDSNHEGNLIEMRAFFSNQKIPKQLKLKNRNNHVMFTSQTKLDFIKELASNSNTSNTFILSAKEFNSFDRDTIIEILNKGAKFVLHNFEKIDLQTFYKKYLHDGKISYL
jgi:DNA-binding MltR family transcriptional regulator